MSRITPFVVGGLVGAGLAVLYAPKTGEQTRAMIAEKANALWGEAKDFSAGMPGTAQDLYNTAREKGAEILKDAPAKAQDIAKTATGKASADDADELRAKIEAARQRIAAQVMENAEQNAEIPAHAKPEAVAE